MTEDRDNPQDVRELSGARYAEALDAVENALHHYDADPGLLNEMRIVRLVGTQSVPWFGVRMHAPEEPGWDKTITVGGMMRYFFEQLGDMIDYATREGLKTDQRHPLTCQWLPAWRKGKADYDKWLSDLGEHTSGPPFIPREATVRYRDEQAREAERPPFVPTIFSEENR
jgi:hypothetical protein